MKAKFRKIQNRNTYMHKKAVNNGEKHSGKREPFKFKQTQILWWLSWKLLDKILHGKKSFLLSYEQIISDMAGDGEHGIGYKVSHSTMYRYLKILQDFGFITLQQTTRKTMIFTIRDVNGLVKFMTEKDVLLKEHINSNSAVLTEQSAVLTELNLKSSLKSSLKPSQEKIFKGESPRIEAKQYEEDAKEAVEKVYRTSEPGLVKEVKNRMMIYAKKEKIKNPKKFALKIAEKLTKYAHHYLDVETQPDYYVSPPEFIKNIEVGNVHLKNLYEMISLNKDH